MRKIETWLVKFRFNNEKIGYNCYINFAVKDLYIFQYVCVYESITSISLSHAHTQT